MNLARLKMAAERAVARSFDWPETGEIREVGDGALWADEYGAEAAKFVYEANPQVILALIALVEKQHAALLTCTDSYTSEHGAELRFDSEKVSSALAEAEKWGL